jgi:hypothetical protein
MQKTPNFGKEEQHAPSALPKSQYYGDKPAETPAALIKGVLPQTGVAAFIGQSGTGKTFQALHLGTCLIPDCDKGFYIDRYRIKRKGGVLYFALEGKTAFPSRVDAAFKDVMSKQMKLGERGRLPFAWNFYQPYLLERGPDLMIKIAEDEAITMRHEFGVDLVAIFIDTLGLAAMFENEDRSAQVIKVISDLQKLSEAIGCLVMPVDHMGKDAEQGARGSSSKRDLPETVLACLGDRTESGVLTNLRMTFHKIRDGEAGRIIPYRLHQVDMGIDEDNDQNTTCVIRWEPERPAPPPRRRADRVQPKTAGVLARAISEVGLPADAAALRAVFTKHHGGSKHTAGAAWRRAIAASGLVLGKDGRLNYVL